MTFADSVKNGMDAVVLARASVRRSMADMLRGLTPRIPVLSYNEVSQAREIKPVGQITITSRTQREAMSNA